MMPKTLAILAEPRPSRSVLITGMPPATAASKPSWAPDSSASLARVTPCLASSALLAVTTGRPISSAALTAANAGPSSPPISSTNRSMPSDLASATGSSNQSRPEMSMPRSRERERAATAVTTMGRPSFLVSSTPSFCRMPTSVAPTLPRPATPIRSGVAVAPSPKSCMALRMRVRVSERGSRPSRRSKTNSGSPAMVRPNRVGVHPRAEMKVSTAWRKDWISLMVATSA